MRTALVHSLEAVDIGEFTDNVTEAKSNKASDSHLFQWTYRTYCHFRLPDTDRKMVQCSDCTISTTTAVEMAPSKQVTEFTNCVDAQEKGHR